MKRTAPRTAFLRDPLTLIALAFALVWGVVALFFRPIGDYGVETDFYGDFAIYSRQWMSGSPSLMNGFRGPLYYLVLGILTVPFRDAFLAGKIISIVSAAIGLWLAGDLARRLFGRTAGTAAALAIAANPTFTEHAYRACSDLFYWFVFVAAVWFLLKDETDRVSSRIWAGALSGAAWLTRANGAALVPAGLVALLATPGSWRGAARRAVLYLVAFVVVSAPWGIYVWSKAGSPFWNRNYENAAIEVLVEKPDMAQVGGFMSAIDFTSFGEVLAVWPAQFARTMLGNAGGHIAQDARRLMGLPWAIVGIAGFALGFRLWRTRRGIVFLALGAITYLSLVPVFYNPRFMITLLVWWGAGTGLLAERLSRILRGDRAGRMILAAFGIAAIAFTFQGIRASQDPKRNGGLPVELLDLAQKARRSGARFDETTPIAARKPHIGYYLDAPVVSIPAGQLAEIGKSGARYLLVSGSEVNVLPALSLLWAPPAGTPPPPGLDPIAQSIVKNSEGKTVRAATLYAVENPAPWTRKISTPLPEPVPPPGGLSRVDFLRVQLVRWYIRWNSSRDAGAVLRLMAPRALERPDVLLLRADLTLERNDLDEAERLYRKVLDLEPGNQRAALALGGIAYLRNDRPAMDRWLTVALGGFPTGRPTVPSADGGGMALRPEDWRGPALDELRQAAWTTFQSRDFASTVAPLAALMDVDPSFPRGRVTLAYALQGIRRNAEAKEAARDFLREHPKDREALQLLDNIP
jgi:hypothetical protein